MVFGFRCIKVLYHSVTPLPCLFITRLQPNRIARMPKSVIITRSVLGVMALWLRLQEVDRERKDKLTCCVRVYVCIYVCVSQYTVPLGVTVSGAWSWVWRSI